MNKLLGIVLFLGLVGFGFAQNHTDSQGRKQGAWVKYYEGTTKVRYKGQFKDDKPVGAFVYYYETGEPSTVLEYESSAEALCKTYHENGSLMAKGYYVNQEKDGVWWYFNPEKLVMAKETFEKGKQVGISYKYFPAPVGEKLIVLEAINYEDGLAQGTWKRFYKDGKVQTEGTYKDGLRHGKCTWFATNGKPDVVGYYKEGNKNGYWRYYEGEEYSTECYVNGVLLEGEMREDYEKMMKEKE